MAMADCWRVAPCAADLGPTGRWCSARRLTMAVADWLRGASDFGSSGRWRSARRLTMAVAGCWEGCSLGSSLKISVRSAPQSDD